MVGLLMVGFCFKPRHDQPLGWLLILADACAPAAVRITPHIWHDAVSALSNDLVGGLEGLSDPLTIRMFG